jgi:hypothetical protein
MAGIITAATLQDVMDDMQPLDAFAVDVMDSQVIFDAGSDKGVVKNDLFTVFRAGRKLTDPQTGKVLGQIETRAGVVSVTRVEKQFSYATPVGKSGKVKRGDKLVRFKELSAYLQDTTEGKTAFAFALQRGLQSLVWQDKKTKATELIFEHTPEELIVKNKQGKVVRVYQLVDTAPAGQSMAAQEDKKSTYAPVYATPAVASGVVAASTAEGNKTKKIRYDIETYGYNQGAALPFSAVMGDFLLRDGQMQLAVIREHEVAVYNVNDNNAELVASVDTPLVKLLAVSWWLPEPGRALVGVSGYDSDEEQVSSMIYSFTGSQLVLVEEELPYMLAANDLNGDGQPEAMLGQEFDQDVFFGRSIKKIALSVKGVKTSSFTGNLPPSFRVNGGAVLDGGNTATYILGNRLHVVSGGHEVFSSGKEMGGSLSSVRYVVNPDDINPLFSSAKIEVNPVAVDIDDDGSLEILVPSADLSAFTTVGGANSIKKTWVSVIKKTGNGTYMKGKIGGEYDQYIQAMGAGNGALYLLTVNANGLFSEGQGGSQLLVLPFKD